MRAFVALEIPDARVLDEIVSFQRELASCGADLKLVERDNLHFTVKFLGEISQSQVREADAALGSLRAPAADVELKGAGAFPNTGRPNVVWLGVDDQGEENMKRIAIPAIDVLKNIGEVERRPFQAHLTLARVKDPRNAGGLASLINSTSQKSFGRTRLTSLKLKSSVLAPTGPVYADIGVYSLV